MCAKIFNGKKAAEKVYDKLLGEITKLKKKYKINPKLTVILVGDDPASKIYIKMKERACEKIGIISQTYKLPQNIKESEVLSLLDKLNKDETVHSILIQFPLSKHLNKNKIMATIFPRKDVDGFNPINLGKVLLGDEILAPCTPKAVIKILEDSEIDVEGKNVVVVNHSNIVGKPLSLMLLNRDATVEVCHLKTKNLREHTEKADVVIVAAGSPKLIKKDMVKEGAVVVDIGINKIEGRTCGDVDFENVKGKAAFLTPVPGGVGPMTVAMLMKNTIICYKNLLKNKFYEK